MENLNRVKSDIILTIVLSYHCSNNSTITTTILKVSTLLLQNTPDADPVTIPAGICPRLGELVTICHGCQEWCWLSADDGDYVSCSEDSQCSAVHRNSCAGACTY